MNAIDNLPSESLRAETHAPRVVSIDIFRGLTMAVMIFVNALSGVRGLPWWTHHALENQDLMTYVDMVFPFFLFIVGMSLPLSVTQRLKRDASQPALWMHVLVRAFSLVVLGLILANADKGDPARMGISNSAWAILALISAGLYLNVYPKSERFPAYSWILRLVGLVGVIGLLAIFRQTTQGGQAAWLDFSYPEILGLIGFSYLAAAILYIPSRRWAWAPLVWFGLLASLNVLTAARLVTFTEHLPLYLWPFGNGAMSCIVMAGVVTSSIFLGTGRRPAQGRSMFLATVFGILMLAAGMALTPFGISKIRATPTWSLYSIGASVLLFTLLYWVCDVRHWARWAFLVRPAGSNTLLTYLLPDLWEYALAAMGITYLETHFNRGWQGVVETFVFTVLILSLAKVLTKARVRLQL